MLFSLMLAAEENTELTKIIETELIDKSPVKDYLKDFSLDMLYKAGGFLLTIAVRLVIAILILVIGFRLVKALIRTLKKVFEKSRMDPTLETFLTSFFNILMKILVVFAAISELGVGASTIIALIGSAGLAIGLSLQGSLANIAGGVVLLFVKPFEVGDYISVQDSQEGTVKAIGILYTRLMTLDNHQVMIPNSFMANTTIENLTHQRDRMEEIIVGVEYEEDIDRVREVLRSVIQLDPDYLPEKGIMIFVKSYEESCINMAVRYWVLSEKYWPSRWRSLENIKKAFDQHGLTIPFNQMDVHVHQQ